MNRETWLNEMAARFAPSFAALGHPLPPFRVSVGFTSQGMNTNAVGECWDKSASTDGRFEIFISPSTSDSLDAAYILAHELVHIAVGIDQGHKGDFAKVALALGFTRPLTHKAPPTELLLTMLQPAIDALGPIPHARMNWRGASAGGERKPRPNVDRKAGGITPREPSDEPASTRPPKQTARLIKAACNDCGYTVRVTSKWLEIGPPHCPVHGAMATDIKEAA
jgi:hypothetical protein